MTTALKYTEDFCEKESNNLFFMSVVDKAKAGGFYCWIDDSCQIKEKALL